MGGSEVAGKSGAQITLAVTQRLLLSTERTRFDDESIGVTTSQTKEDPREVGKTYIHQSNEMEENEQEALANDQLP